MKLKIKGNAATPFAIALVSGLMASAIIYTSGFEHTSSYMFSGLALVSALAGVFEMRRNDP